MRSGPGVWLAKYRSKGIASAAANVRRSWENDPASGPSISSVGLRASPARRSRSLSRSRPTEPLVCPARETTCASRPPRSNRCPGSRGRADQSLPVNLAWAASSVLRSMTSPPDGHRPRGSENSPQCGRCGHGCCTLYRVWTPARPPRPTGPVSPVRCPRGWPAAPPVPRCSKPDSPPPSARSPARSPFHSQGNPIHSSRRPSAAPKSISLKVGWGWMTADRSSAVRPF